MKAGFPLSSFPRERDLFPRCVAFGDPHGQILLEKSALLLAMEGCRIFAQSRLKALEVAHGLVT